MSWIEFPYSLNWSENYFSISPKLISVFHRGERAVSPAAIWFPGWIHKCTNTEIHKCKQFLQFISFKLRLQYIWGVKRKQCFFVLLKSGFFFWNYCILNFRMQNFLTHSLTLRRHMRCFHLTLTSNYLTKPVLFIRSPIWNTMCIVKLRCPCFFRSLGPNQIHESPDRPQVNCSDPINVFHYSTLYR